MSADVRQLRAFVAVAEEASFTRAARRLRFEQPAVTRQVRQLEGLLGTELFRRTTRRVELTEAGRLLLPKARLALEAFDEAVGVVRRLCGSLTGRLVIGCSYDVRHVASELLTPFRALHPGLDVGLWIGREIEILRELELGRTDAAVVWGRPSEAHRSIELAREPIVVALPSTHPLAVRRTVERSLLAGAGPLLLDPTACAAAWHELARELGARVHEIDLVEPSDQAVLAAAHARHAIALVTRRALERDRRPGQVMRPLRPPLTLPVVLRWREIENEALDELVRHAASKT